MSQPSRRAGSTTAPQAFGGTTPTTTLATSSIPMATTSRPFATSRARRSAGSALFRGNQRRRAEVDPAAPVHVAFSAADRATVDRFHRAAVEAGGRDNGAPDLRPHSHDGDYAAFVLDPAARSD